MIQLSRKTKKNKNRKTHLLPNLYAMVFCFLENNKKKISFHIKKYVFLGLRNHTSFNSTIKICGRKISENKSFFHLSEPYAFSLTSFILKKDQLNLSLISVTSAVPHLKFIKESITHN